VIVLDTTVLVDAVGSFAGVRGLRWVEPVTSVLGGA